MAFWGILFYGDSEQYIDANIQDIKIALKNNVKGLISEKELKEKLYTFTKYLLSG